MLIISRPSGSSFTISNVFDADGKQLHNIKVVILGDDRIGIQADKSVIVLRTEVLNARAQEIAKASS
jgi:sRNA-binding carbon storage regulator CsrA